MLALAGIGIGLAFLVLKRKFREILVVEGTYVYTANPCFTEPCLPGMVYAIMTEGGEEVFLTKDRGLLWENIPGIPVGTLVRATGEIWTERDIFGRIVTLLEYDRIESIS